MKLSTGLGGRNQNHSVTRTFLFVLALVFGSAGAARTSNDGRGHESHHLRRVRASSSSNMSTRNLAVLGDRTFIGVRVMANNCMPTACTNPTVDLPQMRNDLFQDVNNMVTQFAACSYDKLTLTPVNTINGKTLNGVYEVEIPQEDVNGQAYETVAGYVRTKLQEEGELGADWMDEVDIVMYFMPAEVAVSTGVAFTAKEIALSPSYYTNTCGHMHEVGHLLGLGHNYEGTDQYGDRTAIMGNFFHNDDDCFTCFNGPKNWFLGWYDDRHAEIENDGPILAGEWSGDLVGVADYADSAGRTVVLKISLGFPDYYVAFNRASGIVNNPREGGDQVLVTSRVGASSVSFLEAMMDQGDTFSIPGGIIEVTNIDLGASPAIAQVEVRQEIPSGKLDVFFLVDNSGSFGDDIGDFRDQLPGIIADIKSQADDAHFGLGTFRDYPIPGYGEETDYPYQRHVAIPSDGAATDGSQEVIDAVDLLEPSGGADAPESQLTALYQAATGEGAPNDANCVNDCSIPAGQGANFRDDAAKIILLWTDSGYNTPGGEPAYPGPGLVATINALQTVYSRRRHERGLMPTPLSIRVAGVARDPDNTDAIALLQNLAVETGAVATQDIDCDDNGSPDILVGQGLVCPNGSAGNIASAFIAVLEGTLQALSPSALCEGVEVSADDGECFATGVSIDNGSSDPSGLEITLTQKPENPYAVGERAVTLKVTNEDGLEGYCGALVTVVDDQDPVLIGFPNDVVEECDVVSPPAPVTATDNCAVIQDPNEAVGLLYPLLSFSEVRVDGSCPQEYTLLRTWTAVDESGNSVEQTQTVQVQDTMAPEISCNLAFVTPSGANPNNPILVNPTAADNCGETTVEIISFRCWRINGSGREISLPCNIELDGGTASILTTGGVGTFIGLTTEAVDECGNPSETECIIQVVRRNDLFV